MSEIGKRSAAIGADGPAPDDPPVEIVETFLPANILLADQDRVALMDGDQRRADLTLSVMTNLCLRSPERALSAIP